MTRKKGFTIAIVIVAILLGGTAIYGFARAAEYQRDLQYGYRRALNDLGDHVGNIEAALDKSVYANTVSEQSRIAAGLMREAGMAKSSLAVLPVGDSSLDNISKFITQVGDFSASMERSISSGQKITPDEFKTIQSLKSYSQKLNSGMRTVDIDFSGTKTFRDAMKETAQDFSNFPSLIYDGPFSDSVMNRKPQLLQGKAAVLQGNAQNIAADFLNLQQSKLTHAQDTAGTLPTYNFTANSGAISISVTKAGGFVSGMSNERSIGEEKLSYSDCSAKARAFLDSHGIRNMKESYYIMQDGICLINFAYETNGILCYPDLVKVGIALDNGEVVRYEPMGFLMNHRERSGLTAKLTVQQAQKSVSPNLTVGRSRLALIPIAGNGEKLTYEFLCSGKNKERVLVYINASTGYEENILILQQTDRGILTK